MSLVTILQKRLAEFDAKAKEFAEKANAIRFALAEANGAGTIDKKLKDAQAMHESRPNASAGLNRHQLHRARLDMLREKMAPDTPSNIPAVVAVIEEFGLAKVDISTARNALIALKAKRTGHKTNARWVLPKSKGKKPPRKDTRDHHAEATRERRQRTAQILAKLSKQEDPVPLSFFDEGRGVSVLVQHGYVKKTPNGFIRTEKEFTV